MKKGQVVETGTHQSLLENPAGVYSGLVHAQQLNLGEGVTDSDQEDEDKGLGAVLTQEKSVANSAVGDTAPEEEKEKKKTFANSFIRLLIEQRSRWPWYILTIFFAAGAGGKTTPGAALSLQLSFRLLTCRCSCHSDNGVPFRADHCRVQLRRRPRQDAV